jgi:hypothetical protein
MMTGMVSRHINVAVDRPLLEERDAIGIGHPDVEQHQIDALTRANRTRFARAVGKQDSVSFITQDFGQQFADADFIIDHEDLGHS